MFCPRCGTQNTEGTKFCRQCGLGLAPLTGYVAGGGTGALGVPVLPATAAPLLPETSEMLVLKQKRALTILAFIFLPIFLAIMGEVTINNGEIFMPTLLLMPLGITWAMFRYKTQLRRLQEQQAAQYAARLAAPVMAPTPQPMFQAPAMPAQLPPPTNPFQGQTPVAGSVIEDDTRKLPIENR